MSGSNFQNFGRFFPMRNKPRGRLPQDELHVPFKAPKNALILKDRVSASRDETKGAYCLPEMTMLLACMKKNEFADRFCAKEIEEFNKCAVNHFVKVRERKARRKEGGYIAGQKMDHVGLSEYMKKYPNI